MPEDAERRLRRWLVVDGPPLPAAILAFAAVQALTWGAGAPLTGLVIMAIGACAAVIAYHLLWTRSLGRSRRDEILWPARDRMRRRGGAQS